MRYVPVEDVEDTIESKEKDVVCSDVLYLFQFIDHEELWQDGEGFEPDAEGPGEVEGVKGLVDDGGQKECSSIEIIVRERIRLFVVAKVEWLAVSHEVHGIGGDSNENDFHNKEIEASPYKDEIEVAGEEDDKK
jgi:hypothetical protein